VSARVELNGELQVSLGTTLTRIVPGDGVREIQVSAQGDVYLVLDDALDDGDAVPATARHRLPAGLRPIVLGKTRLLLAGVSATTITLLGGGRGAFGTTP
jgi:hypothetical protein